MCLECTANFPELNIGIFPFIYVSIIVIRLLKIVVELTFIFIHILTHTHKKILVQNCFKNQYVCNCVINTYSRVKCSLYIQVYTESLIRDLQMHILTELSNC